MDPVIEWLTCKNEPIDEPPNTGNVARSWQWRERGINPPNSPSNKTVLENIAEDILVQKPLKVRCCDLPGYPRSTFLMVFSPDGTKVASTHGNHNVYVTELSSGKHVRILKGHPRTPWCIAFHPSHPQLIGSGCLGGQVRVWDIASGGSEVWNVHKEAVIASIAFHPREQLLVIASYNELYFWDWSQPAPFTSVSTNNINEKVRYVAFDALGYKLITGISLWNTNTPSTNSSSILQQNPTLSAMTSAPIRRDDFDDHPGGGRPPENPGHTQDMIVNSYQNLVQRYDSLVRNYQRLFMVRHRLTNTPPPPNTTDRGTDPMETDRGTDPTDTSPAPGPSGLARSPRFSNLGPVMATVTAAAPLNDEEPPFTNWAERAEMVERARAAERAARAAIADAETPASRLLNLDVLSFDNNPPRNQDTSNQEHSIFGSRSSAFQPLTEGRSFRTVDQSERSTRLLPNPFSNTSTRANRTSLSDGVPPDVAHSSRTSIFTSTRPLSTFAMTFLERARNLRTDGNQSRMQHTSVSTDDILGISRPVTSETSAAPPTASTSGTNTPPRPTMTNTSTQMSPTSVPVDAQTINESLDLIRDILRDSGTRLLNLITNMSLSTLASVERGMPRRGAHSDDSGGGATAGGSGGRARANRQRRLLSPRLSLLSSSSDSDSDQSLEVNITRTMNSSFSTDSLEGEQTPTEPSPRPTERTVVDLDSETRNEGTSADTGRINVTLVNDRFRVRTQNESSEETISENRDNAAGTETENPGPSTSQATHEPTPRPSTSRDFFAGGSSMSSEEAYRKVKGGVSALQKHTTQLTNLWLRGHRVTMRDLRTMWENLRRRILALQREPGRQEAPSTIYTRSLLERCMMLTDLTENTRSSSRGSRSGARSETSERNQENRDSPGVNANSTATEGNAAGTSSGSVTERRTPPRSSQPPRPTPGLRSSPSLRRRLQARWRTEEDLRRRNRNAPPNRLTPRTNRSRRDFARAIEISATRHEIRMRAMQVLSVMFNMMMMCLEERGLSQLIITMLRTLKKALALTCLMLMINKNTARQTANQQSQSPSPSTSRVDPQIVIRIQNVDHSGPVNVDGIDEQSSTRSETSTAENNTVKKSSENKPTNAETPVQTTPERMEEDSPSPSTSATSASQRWSNRLAVQIAAANRNTSATARTRRELYLESKRQKALHKTNPAAHPITKKRAMPPVSHHKIPALRIIPSKLNLSRLSTQRHGFRADEPVAGPSNAPQNDGSQRDSRDEMFNEFDVNVIRLAHLHAVRQRNAARNRFRRLQTIRLYTPSSVREMFTMPSYNREAPSGSRSPQNGSEPGNRRSFTTYRPHILTPRSESSRQPEEPPHFHTVLNSMASPLMLSDLILPNNAEPQQSGQPLRLPRIHEYLQPIILAQNAMVLDDEGPGGEGGGGGGGAGGGAGGGGGGGARRISAGMAGLLDAGIISEALPAPSHRVQAWDFTTGDTPDIADSTKNVVVQRCRIHNDASIDISKDGRLLVALLPVARVRNTNHWLGVYSLEWSRLGQCLHTAVLEQSVVSVALSPTARHLAVGLGSRRFATTPHRGNNVIALLYRLDPLENSSRTGLSPIKELEQNWEQGFTSLNCLRWAPQPGQGLVYANNTGQLIIMS